MLDVMQVRYHLLRAVTFIRLVMLIDTHIFVLLRKMFFPGRSSDVLEDLSLIKVVKAL